MIPSVERFFEHYAGGLISFSPERISQYYQTPLAIYSDQGVQTVTDASETIAFWQEGIKPYQNAGIKRIGFNIISDEQLSEKIFTAKVSWQNYDEDGEIVAKETNFYILSENGDELKISGLIVGATE